METVFRTQNSTGMGNVFKEKLSNLGATRGVVVGADGLTTNVNMARVGKTFGYVKVLSYRGMSAQKHVPMWNCECTCCGREVTIPETAFVKVNLKCKNCEEDDRQRMSERMATTVASEGTASADSLSDANDTQTILNLDHPFVKPYRCDSVIPDKFGNNVKTKLNLIGHKFGSLSVISLYDYGTSYPRTVWNFRWLVRCSCGREETRTTRALLQGALANKGNICTNCNKLTLRTNKTKIADRIEHTAENAVKEATPVATTVAVDNTVEKVVAEEKQEEQMSLQEKLAQVCLEHIKGCATVKDAAEAVSALHGLIGSMG